MSATSTVYAIMRVAKGKCKSMGAVGSVVAHNTREKMPDNADPAMSHKNRCLWDGEGGGTNPTAAEVVAMVKEAVEACEPHRKDAVLAVETIYTTSAGWDGDVSAWAKDTLRWVIETYGTENVKHVVLHMDEHTPHIHCIHVPVVPVLDAQGRPTGKTKLCAAQMFDGPEKLRKLQDSYHAAVKHHGLDRGVVGSTATHQRVKRFYGQINMPVGNAMAVEVDGISGAFLTSEQLEIVQSKLAHGQLLAAKVKKLEADARAADPFGWGAELAQLKRNWNDQDALASRLGELSRQEEIKWRARAEDDHEN